MANLSIPGYTIRHATESDVGRVMKMILELAEYEKSLSSVRMTETLLLSTLSFSITGTDQFTAGHGRCLLAFPDNSPETAVEVVGMAFYYISYSTWTGPGMWLEDQYVVPEHRKNGLGTSMLKVLAGEVKKLNPSGYGRLEWEALRWNKLGIDFYQGEDIGVELNDEYIGFKVTGEALEKLAGQSA